MPRARDPAQRTDRGVSRGPLFLPRGYTENQPEALGPVRGPGQSTHVALARARNARRSRDPVYRAAARVAPRRLGVVVDIGCGNGHGLEHHLRRAHRIVGVDDAEVVALAHEEFPQHDWVAGDLRSDEVWEWLRSLRPALVVCADLIQHVDDPLDLLARLRALSGRGGRLILSSPDRDRIEDQPALGPPKNPHHVREWTFTEMTRLLEARGFTIRSSRHVLPRRYGLTKLDTKIVAWRLLHLRPIPARRSCMVFELTTA